MPDLQAVPPERVAPRLQAKPGGEQQGMHEALLTEPARGLK